jgi:alkaline phosphatase D
MLFAALNCTKGASFSSDWKGSHIWVGPEYWANPLQDWRVEKGELVGFAAHDRSLHLLTHQVENTSGGFEMEVEVRLDGLFDKKSSAERSLGGFRFGIQGELNDYRHALIHGVDWIDAGIRGDGKLIIGSEVSSNSLPVGKWIQLRLSAETRGKRTSLTILGSDETGQDSVTVETSIVSDLLTGNMALLANGPTASPDRTHGNTWRFKDWVILGTATGYHSKNSFGPILWTQYTLSRSTLKLAALMAPVEEANESVRLQLRRNGNWEEVGSDLVDPLSRTALFRLDNWDDGVDVDYRVVYKWQGKEYSWSGTVRRDPKNKETVTIGAFSCDNGYIFPNTRIVGNVAIQDPDLLYFAGDQIYEGFGGFGKTRSPVDLAALDYLRKYWMFGWSWRELLKDRPSVIIPDDHDVFQGNIWGHGGRRIPDMSDPPTGQDQSKGGYIMHPDWVNAVQRTQTVSLPDPVDPRPVEQGIEVYFTDISYGGLSLAVLEDRKFKSGPGSFLNAVPGDRRNTSSNKVNLENAELLGPRQEAFLQSWVSNNEADFKVALTQTIFCKVTTHTGRQLNASESGSDSNGWPPNKRIKALKILGDTKVVMVHGDQHLGALVHHGVDDWEDSAIGFMVPGTANGFPRAWWPEEPGILSRVKFCDSQRTEI